MKTTVLFILTFSFSILLDAQTVVPLDTDKIPQNKNVVAPSDSIVPGKGAPEEQLKEIKEVKIEKLSDTTGNEPQKSALVDTTIQNKYGDLLNDDTTYNKKYPIWIPIVETFGACAVTWAFDRYALKAEYARIGPESWKYNIKNGWEWDTDRFGVNFIGHPYSGTFGFSAARSTGYNYIQSAAFSVGGSLMWEYFCETTRPSYNDIINTPVNGAFIGEILYRLSSNFLDDRTRGVERFSRELLAGIIDPVRGLNRLIQGKSFRRTNIEVYQKEPLNISLYAGLHIRNAENKNVFLSGTNSQMLNVQLDYGNPFENRSRKPFDFFKFRSEFSLGVGKRFIDNLSGYGILKGKNKNYGKNSFLLGFFQYYDYLDSKIFELGTIGLGGGLFSKSELGKNFELYTNAHIAVIPFAGNTKRHGTDDTEVRDYDFGDGLEGKFETTLNLGKHVTLSLLYYYYFIHTTVGPAGNNSISILKPRITVRVYRRLSLGFEHFIYYNDRYPKDFATTHTMRTEQKIFLFMYIENSQRRGHYN